MFKTILYVPSIRVGNGTGHLKRAMKICREIAYSPDLCPLIFLDGDSQQISQWIRQFPDLNQLKRITRENLNEFRYDLIILDRRETTWQEFRDWENLAPVVFLDEGGESREFAPLLIDTLPSIQKHKANFSELSFLDLPWGKKDIDWKNPSILISFGGEDPEKLTAPVLDIVINQFVPKVRKIAVVQGPMMETVKIPPGVLIFKDLDDLTPLYKEYDILVSAFGMTPLEASSAGCAVLLVNPSSYHEKLSQHAGLLSAGVKKKGLNRLPAVYKKMVHEKIKYFMGKEASHDSLAQFILKLKGGGKSSCPLCLTEKNRVIHRFQSRTYYECQNCHNYYMVNWQEEEEVYDREYFYSRYKNQYGKTYLEDFQYIKKLGKERIHEIERILKPKPPKKNYHITDLGCAFGPFLASAGDKGYSCRGVEINQEGAQWIESNLGIPVINGSLTDHDVKETLKKNKTDIITLWYVIEHIPFQKELLDDIYQYLNPGGMLALGTPSARGISALKNKKSFLKASPADHFVVYTPRGIRRILDKSGFSVKKIKSIGHHPERFAKWVGKKGTILYNLFELISRIFSLGDSLEVYALKVDIKELRK